MARSSEQPPKITRMEIVRRPDGWNLLVERGERQTESFHPTEASLMAELRANVDADRERG